MQYSNNVDNIYLIYVQYIGLLRMHCDLHHVVLSDYYLLVTHCKHANSNATLVTGVALCYSSKQAVVPW